AYLSQFLRQNPGEFTSSTDDSGLFSNTRQGKKIALSSQNIVRRRDELKCQIAVVTGSGRGIGRAIALTLATAGAYTAVLARSQSEVAKTVAMIEEAGGRAQAFVADVTDAMAVGTTMAEIERSLGPVNLLVNNAA